MIETEKIHLSLERERNGNTITLHVHDTDPETWEWLKNEGLGISKPIDGKTQHRWVTIHAEVIFFKRSKC